MLLTLQEKNEGLIVLNFMERIDRVSKEYWDSGWEVLELPPAIDFERGLLKNPIPRRFHEFFTQIFSGLRTSESSLLEIGCAASVWLPYFAKEFGFQIFGIDYSEKGCCLTERILDREKVKGTIICADFFNPPKEMIEVFDVVISFGVAEHFTPTERVLAAFARFLKSGGIMITLIPNMIGSVGFIQKWLNKPIYDIHVLLSCTELAKAHEKSGLSVISCRYFISTDFSVVNLNGLSRNISFQLKRVLLRTLIWFSKGIWLFENVVSELPATQLLSPYMVCTSKK
ncbi:MAG TPA: methyltransferase domain-containing protein [Candidatus Limnocylindrales bacterium]|nr:methyltransferase domain-containing protein [Candidatus Limnocylindrales bacterium]